jgi:hypothetical protein
LREQVEREAQEAQQRAYRAARERDYQAARERARAKRRASRKHVTVKHVSNVSSANEKLAKPNRSHTSYRRKLSMI